MKIALVDSLTLGRQLLRKVSHVTENFIATSLLKRLHEINILIEMHKKRNNLEKVFPESAPFSEFS